MFACERQLYKILLGLFHRFQDRNRESGSNAAVLKVMETLRIRFPQIVYGAPKS